MPTYEVTSPDGRKFSVTAPEGASQDEVLAYAKKNYTAPASAVGADVPDPTEGMSQTEKLLAGIGMGMAKIGRATGQAAGMAVDAVMPKPTLSLGDLVTGNRPKPYSERIGFPTQASVESAKRTDAPLGNTGAGTLGNLIGQTAATIPAAFIPGANTYLGASLVGAGLGALTTEGDVRQRAIGGGLGALGGAAGKFTGDMIGGALQGAAQRRLDQQVANAGRDAAAQRAISAGYAIPPADTNPSIVNELLNGISGKIKTAQSASAMNQPVTNQLAKAAVGAAPDQPLSVGALDAIRKQAGQAYEAVASTGTVAPGSAYDAALDKIVAPFVKSAQGFPNAKANPVLAEIESLRSPAFDAGSAVAKISELRASSDAAYRAGDKISGKALKSGANALEDALDAHLVSINASADLLKNYRGARQLIAKTYSVQSGLNDVTGDVAAAALAKQLQKGKPLSGDLRTIAETASAFPKATQALKEAPKQLSPWDMLTSVIAATSTGHPAAAAIPLARPAIRAGILSGPYQAAMSTPKYTTGPVQGALESALASEMTRRYLPIGGALTAADLQ